MDLFEFLDQINGDLEIIREGGSKLFFIRIIHSDYGEPLCEARIGSSITSADQDLKQAVKNLVEALKIAEVGYWARLPEDMLSIPNRLQVPGALE